MLAIFCFNWRLSWIQSKSAMDFFFDRLFSIFHIMGFDKFEGNANPRSWNNFLHVTLLILSILTAISLLVIEILTFLSEKNTFKRKLLVIILCNIFIVAILLDVEVRYANVSYAIIYWAGRLLSHIGMFLTTLAEINLLRSFIFMSNFLSVRFIRIMKGIVSLSFFSAALGDISVRN